jgi:alpha-beta hydrolase superfamily lysophospholipase
MQTHAITFYSDGLRLDGELYVPDGWEPGQELPAVVACSGYQGLKTIHPARFARALVPNGYVVLGFDYRGFGYSDGPRGRLVPQEQVEDVRAAVSFLEARPEVDASRIGLIGWALGGGVVIAEAAEDERVRAVVACNAIGDGWRSTRFMHDEESWQRLMDRIAADRRTRAQHGSSELVHPFEVVRLDTVTGGYVSEELYKAPGFGMPVTLEAAERLLRFAPDRLVHQLAPRPLLLIHGDQNELHAPEESKILYENAGEPKRLVLLEGKGHTEWMFDDDPTFLQLRSEVLGFLDDALTPQAAPTA